jgi:ubiquinone/menaquinone biosynthesis C-methylase UbiE
LGLVAASPPVQQNHQGVAQHAAEMNKKFSDPKLDVREQVERFESDSRDIYTKRLEIVRTVGLRPGEAVADIGAGTGLFTRLFAEQVGPKGTVYAVDIGPAFLKHIAEQAKRHGQGQVVKTVLNTQDATNLPPDSIDVAFTCDTYHHFEHPGRMLGSIHRALKPGGRLVIIDFDLRADSSEMVKHRARGPKELYFREIADAGFERVEGKVAPKLKDDFFAVFRRVDHGPPPATKGKDRGDSQPAHSHRQAGES